MRVLLIRLRLIGDVVLSTPLIRAVKRTFPGATLSYLVERDAAAVVAGNPHLNDVIVVERSRGLARIADDLRLAWRLSRRFDVVIDMHGGPRSSWLTLATRRAAAESATTIAAGVKYTRHRAARARAPARHSVVKQWDLLSAIDGWTGAPPVPADDAVEMPLDPAADRRIAGRLQETGVEPRHELILIHVSASNPFRRWPEPAFAEVVSSLVRELPARRVILSSGPSDRAAADRIAATARDLLPAEARSRVVDFGEFNLPELRALIARSRLFIGGDTGPLHVAAATATPIVAIYGPTLPARSTPWRPETVPTESVEVSGLACRPCDQRVCAPGDYRADQLTPPRGCRAERA